MTTQTLISDSVIEQMQTALIDDDFFTEAIQRVSLQLAEEICAAQPFETDEEDVYDLATELYSRVSIA